MGRYFASHGDVNKATLHYQCNIELSEAFYSCLSVLEVALRNAMCRELTKMAGREDWYVNFSNTAGLKSLNNDIKQANKRIVRRGEVISHSKIVAELTLGFWVSMLNSEYEKVLWKDLRRAFPTMPKTERKRKNISTPLNRIRNFRNRIFHHEPICWNLDVVKSIHRDMLEVMGWINTDLPTWVSNIDRVDSVITTIKQKL